MPLFIATMISLLTSTAEEIVVHVSTPEVRPPPETLESLNSFLRDRLDFPRIRWHLEPEDDDVTGLKEFAAVVEQGIPTAHERKRLFFESFWDETALRWPGGSIMLSAL